MGNFGNFVFYFQQIPAKRQFGRHVGQRVSGRLGSQRAGTGQPGIDLNDKIIKTPLIFPPSQGGRIESILHVAFADNSQTFHYFNTRLPKPVILFVVQRLTGRNDDGIARMDAERIHIFHIAHRHGIVVLVPDNLIFNFLVVMQIFFNQDLRRYRQRATDYFFQLFFISGHS